MIALPENFSDVSLTMLPYTERKLLIDCLDDADNVNRALQMRPGKLPPVNVLQRVPWSENAWYIPRESDAAATLYHAIGAFYIQEPSAMSAVPALDIEPGQNVLDLCAAPGGKSIQIASLLEGNGILYSNEINPGRAAVLAQNLERLGVTNAVITNMAAEELCSRFNVPIFDRILVDAPCSGEGMFRRLPESRLEWSEDEIRGCVNRQRSILKSAVRILKPGGVLVYSTCTFNSFENEENVRWLLDMFPDLKYEDFKLNSVGCSHEGCLHLWPHRVRGEGLFISRFRKEGDIQESQQYTHDNTGAYILPEELRQWVPGLPLKDWYIRKGDKLWLLPQEIAVPNKTRVLRYGLGIGEWIGKTLRPLHHCVSALPSSAFRSEVILSKKETISFIKGEELFCEKNKAGWCRVSFEDYGIGWGKASNGILKNHLPKSLRANIRV